MKRVIVLAAFALLAATPSLAQISTDPAQVPTGSYRMESAHSQVLFSIVHSGMMNYYGRFDRASGTLNFDSVHPEKSSTDIAIDVESIDTPSDELNTELRSAGTFNTGRFPNAIFKSTFITRTGATTGKIIGNLTLHGVTRPVTLDATFEGGGANPLSGGYAMGFKAVATIRRKDFGITGMRWESFVSDDVNLIIEATFNREKN